MFVEEEMRPGSKLAQAGIVTKFENGVGGGRVCCDINMPFGVGVKNRRQGRVT